MIKKAVVSGMLALTCVVQIGNAAGDAGADEIYPQWQQMHATKAKALETFNEAKFGMFIHWGVYSHLGGIWKGETMEEGGIGARVAEWIMRRKEIPREEYAEVASAFNPTEFDADAWAQLAVDAGMKYMVITSKHHDGFALFDSAHSEWDIVDATPFKRDVIQELYEACARKGIRFGVYYSHGLDWFDGGDGGRKYAAGEDPERLFRSVNDWDPSPHSYDTYLETKAFPQIAELTEQMPELFLVWFDYAGPLPESKSFDFYRLIYQNNPETLVNSRISRSTLPRHLGDYQSAGDNHIPTEEDIDSTYWETCGTTNNSWGYKSYDGDWKSTLEVLSWLVVVVSRGGNYLLNVGPDGKGVIPPESAAILREVGEWLEMNGEAIYGTQAWTTFREGPTEVSAAGTSHREKEGFNASFTSEDFWFTQKDDAVYVMALKWPEDNRLLIRSMQEMPVKAVRLLGSNEVVAWEAIEEGLQVTLPGEPLGDYGFALEVVSVR